jgi:polysaccharide export outer membrane protein
MKVLSRIMTTAATTMLAAAVMLAGCASTGKGPAAATTDQPQSEYRVGPGDALTVYVWNHPELSRDVPVRPDGRISTPLVDDMMAAGKTPSQLARDLEQRLSEYVRSPTVNIIITKAEGTLGDQIRVLGQAGKPQALPYRDGMTLLDVMIAVGGLGEFASGNRAKIVRNVNGKPTEIRVRLKDLVQSGDTSANVPMHPGDVLIIPESRF